MEYCLLQAQIQDLVWWLGVEETPHPVLPGSEWTLDLSAAAATLVHPKLGAQEGVTEL